MSDMTIELDQAIEPPATAPTHVVYEPIFPSTRTEGLLIALLFAVGYGVAGYFTVASGHIVQFGALERLADAYMSWWNNPPKLAAIGLSTAPVGTLAFLGPALVKPFATSLTALPLVSAVAGGATMSMVNTLLARCGFARALRWVAIALLGLNPMTVFYAGNGSPEMIAVFLVAAALLAVVSFRIADETRYLIGAGLAMGVAVMVDYTLIAWALGLMLTISFIGPGPRGGQAKLRSSLLLFLTPVFYAVLIWTILNAVILKNPFQWIEIGSVQTAANLDPAVGLVSAHLGSAAGDMGQVILGIAPILILAVPLLLISALGRRDSLGFGLIFTGVLAVAAVIARALLEDRASFVSLRAGLPLVILGIAALAWLFRNEEGWRAFVGTALLIGLVAAIPLSWHSMRTYSHQNQEQAFTRFVETRDSQEGTTSLGGYTVGVDPELAMADYINNHLKPPENSILTDSKVTYGVVLTSGKPGFFVDRADYSEGEWLSIRDEPFGKVKYMLVAGKGDADLIRQRYPGLNLGEQPGLVPIFHTSRYVLVKLEAGAVPTAAATGKTSVSSQPRLFTPKAPVSPAPLDQTTPSEAGLSPLPEEVQGAAAGEASAGEANSAPKVEGE